MKGSGELVKNLLILLNKEFGEVLNINHKKCL